jgi:hypothetical protein
MAQAKSEDAETLRVRFVGLPGPPARLVAGEVVIEAGKQGKLPAALARELAANPNIGLELLDEELPPAERPRATSPACEPHESPADEPEKE